MRAKPPPNTMQTDILRFRRSKGIRAVTRYSTPRKFANLVRAKLEQHTRALKPTSLPYRAAVDVVNTCNLKCPLCPTGQRRFGRDVQLMPVERLDGLLDEFGDYLYMLDFFNWGEPLLHPQIGEFVERVHKRNIFTRISSNLSHTKRREQIEAVCDAGLDYMLLSIDGATQDVYEQYRKGGNLELVLDNVAHIVNYKRINRLQTPILEWRFLRFDFNQHQAEATRALARKLGVDIFTIENGFIPGEVSDRKDEPEYRWALQQKTCAMLYKFVLLHPDGGIAPCCTMIDKRDDFGDIQSGSLREMWTNERYTQARMMFDPKRVDQLPPHLDHPCFHCPVARNQSHLQNYLRNNERVRFDGDLGMANGEMAVRSVRDSGEALEEPPEVLAQINFFSKRPETAAEAVPRRAS